MNLSTFIIFFQVFYFLYFIGINLYYLMLNISAFFLIKNHLEERPLFNKMKVYSGFELPITIIVPCYNEEKTITETVNALLQLNYPEYEIVVVNDGSTDNTMQVLIEKFSLAPNVLSYKKIIGTEEIHDLYHSTSHPNIQVINKANGGKSDALNAGINLSRFPLFCCIDADSILTRDSLNFIVTQFLDEPKTIACGGTIRIANGCEIKNGQIIKIGLPRNVLALIQTIEYLRAFLFGRLGWVPFNALLIISGSFSVFKKEAVIEVGGYSRGTIGEDMELIVHLHHHFRTNKIPYKIVTIPEPIAYTETPEDLKSLRNQRVRWQRGLSESLSKNFDLLFHPRGGFVGWLSFPTSVIFEWFGPIIEISGYLFFIIGFLAGIISIEAMFAFLILSIGFSLFISVVTLGMEEISFRNYPKTRSIIMLFFAAMLENLGFRQLNTIWRMQGIFGWIFRTRAGWGTIRRKGTG